MAINTNWYPMPGKIGLGLGTVFPYLQAGSALAPEYTGPPAKLLERIEGNLGSEFVMVQASTTVSQYNAVIIDQNGYANNMTSALVASNAYAYGFAQFNVTQANGGATQTGDFFWALLKANGGVGMNIQPSANKGAQLYINPTTPGWFTSSATSNAIMNLVNVISVTTTGQAEAIVRGYLLPALNMSVAGATA